MSKRCPHCDGEIMPSVVKCRHCGKNINDPVEPRSEASRPSGVQTTDGDSSESGTSALEAALDPTAPPAGIAFRPSVAVTPVQAATSAPTPPAATPAAPPSAPPASASAFASGFQDWGSPVESKTGTDPYWQVKTVAPTAASALGVPVRPKIDPGGAISAVLLLVAGAVAVFASLQPWIDSSSNGLKGVEDELIRGSSGWAGKAAAALGLACIILALMSFVRGNAASLKVGLVAGLGIVAVGTYTLLTAASQIQATLVADREIEGMREDAARGLVAGWLDSGALKVTPQTWLYVVVGAGVVAIIGGLVAMSVKAAPAPRSGKSQLPAL